MLRGADPAALAERRQRPAGPDQQGGQRVAAGAAGGGGVAGSSPRYVDEGRVREGLPREREAEEDCDCCGSPKVAGEALGDAARRNQVERTSASAGGGDSRLRIENAMTVPTGRDRRWSISPPEDTVSESRCLLWGGMR